MEGRRSMAALVLLSALGLARAAADLASLVRTTVGFRPVFPTTVPADRRH